ncbi:MAG: PASTA domain-containing protein [Chloroflexi bacterium]|nr:PASTA domain-containing protein [Chloroflexota bacterium]
MTSVKLTRIVEISGVLGAAVSVFAWLGISPALTAPSPSSTPTPAAIVAPAPAIPTPTVAIGMVKVPTVIGVKEDQAKRVLETSGLRLGKVTRRTVAGGAEGTVVAQAPSAGQEIRRGSSVDIVVNQRGKEKREDD